MFIPEKDPTLKPPGEMMKTWIPSIIMGILAAPPQSYPPPKLPPPSNKGLIAGLIKGNQWLISPDHKAGYFLGG